MTNTIVIGDVHGSYELLLDTVEPHIGSGNELVLLGDLFDRSPESDGDLNVLEFVRDMNEHPDAYGLSAVESLMGNHEALLLDALTGDIECWLMNGGNVDFAVHLIENPSHVEWIMKRPPYSLIRNKHTVLVHAGVRPNIPLTSTRSLLICTWIRPDPYIPHNLPYTIIHGHTIHDEITHYPDRIAIDTGAFHTGNLSTYCYLTLCPTYRWALGHCVLYISYGTILLCHLIVGISNVLTRCLYGLSTSVVALVHTLSAYLKMMPLLHLQGLMVTPIRLWRVSKNISIWLVHLTLLCLGLPSNSHIGWL